MLYTEKHEVVLVNWHEGLFSFVTRMPGHKLTPVYCKQDGFGNLFESTQHQEVRITQATMKGVRGKGVGLLKEKNLHQDRFNEQTKYDDCFRDHLSNIFHEK